MKYSTSDKFYDGKFDIDKFVEDATYRFNRVINANISTKDFLELNELVLGLDEKDAFINDIDSPFIVHEVYWRGFNFFAVFYLPANICFTFWSIYEEVKKIKLVNYHSHIKRYLIEKKRVCRRDMKSIRHNLYSKDNICKLCYYPIDNYEDASVDHVIPLSRGGTNDLENLQLAHKVCNAVKGDRLIKELIDGEVRLNYLYNKKCE